MNNYQYEVGDIVKLKKQHPCGSQEWEILRVGADVIADVEAEPVDDANEPVVSEAEVPKEPEPAPSIPTDDPNRQLTPDEIAALTASM